ncbi:ribonuclease R [Thiovibrio frasassiensis]|uniref:Ribonuclease R n=1 Tax=Thiovibrio frasassiensis TaxID=2984131 RepID=A0A9X4MCW4_9BACT|nr:ribonuclease R [Thiovibrio frasassiensis]MDG4475289.1 ribonuclease R [Thiovibrio frasassiensis]
MTQRRKVFRSKQGRPGKRQREGTRVPRHQQEARFEGEILGKLFTAEMPLSGQDLFAALGLSKSHRQEVLGVLEDLCRRKVLSCKRDTFALRKSAELFGGQISVNPKGYGFVSPAEAPPELEIDQDVFIPPGMLGGAAHSDKVLVQLMSRRQGRYEGRVIAVLNRATSRLVGVYMAGGVTGLVIPEDSRFPYNLVIRKEDSRGAKNGDAVLAEVTSFAAGQRNLDGIILEVLGNPKDIQVQTEMVIRKFDLPHAFSAEVTGQVESLDPEVKMTASRTDLRGVVHVTIDGETARDFDDAVAIESLKNGYRLYVSIADVSHYVRPHTPVDVEAYQRGTSVYFPTRVIPMLPERLSNNLCSLVPNEDRYTFTAVLDFDAHGKRLGKRFMKSIIRSRHRLTYTTVKQVLTDRDPAVLNQYADIIPALEMMGCLALELEKRRIKRGSIGFELPEPLAVLGEDNTVQTIKRSERNQAHKLIEEFMLAANEAVAETQTEGKIDSLYRIHEPPDPIKVAEFTEFAQSMGLNVDEGDGSPKWFGQVLAMAAGTPQEYIISNLLLRTMQQARYSPQNLGHFGLAATNYTHFTSPIRRYPDLMVHRALAASLQKKGGGKPGPETVSTEEAGGFLSKRERIAVEADREMMERLQVHFMADKIDETFEAIISGVTAFGLFVELTEVFVNGAVPITEMRDDYYELEEGRHRLIGQRSKTVFQIGDLVRVRLTSVEIPRRRINFSVEEKLARATDLIPPAPRKRKASENKGEGKGRKKPVAQPRKRAVHSK